MCQFYQKLPSISLDLVDFVELVDQKREPLFFLRILPNIIWTYGTFTIRRIVIDRSPESQNS